MQPRVVAIIQARMASSRLPGKVLLDIAGQPMLAHVCRRTALSLRVDHVLVATTIDSSDDAVAEYCKAHHLHCLRGSQYDVLDRYVQAARASDAEVVVRITADCPAIDAGLIDAAVDLMLGARHIAASEGPRKYDFDFVANRLPPPFRRTYPIGLDVEVCSSAALERAWSEGHEPQQREHVMPYLYEGVALSPASSNLETGLSMRGFRVALINNVPDLGGYRWTVDTPEDMDFMRQVYARFEGHEDFSWRDLLELVRREPSLTEINSGVRHKTLGDLDARALES